MLTDHLKLFLNWLEYEKKYSPHTLNSYRRDVCQFQEFLSAFGDDVDHAVVSKSDAKSWIMSLMKEKYHERSVHRKIVSNNRFYTFLISEGITDTNPFQGISKPKIPKRLAGFLEESVMSSVLDQGSYPRDFAGVRDFLCISLLYEAGLRISELIGLQVQSIDGDKNEITVKGKGGKYRIIPVSPNLLDTIRRYQSGHAELFGANPESFLLVTDKGRKLYPMFINRLVKKHLAILANTSKKNPHLLRHSFATHLLNNGSDINAIKELLGHSSLASTAVYTHNSIGRLKQVYKNTHPRK